MGSFTVTVLTNSKDISEVVKIMAPFDRESEELIDSNVGDFEVYDYYMVGALKSEYMDIAPVFLAPEEKVLGDDILQLYYRKKITSRPYYLYDEFAHPYFSQRLTPDGHVWSNVARVADIEFDRMKEIDEHAVREELQELKDSGGTGYIDNEILFNEDGVDMQGSKWSSVDALARYRSMFHTHAVITPECRYMEADDFTREEWDAVSRQDRDALLAVKEKYYAAYLKFLREYPDCYAWYVFCKSESI